MCPSWTASWPIRRPANVGDSDRHRGIAGVRYEEVALVDDPRTSRIVFLFDGNTECEINCQSNADGRERINQGCDQVLATLRKR